MSRFVAFLKCKVNRKVNRNCQLRYNTIGADNSTDHADFRTSRSIRGVALRESPQERDALNVFVKKQSKILDMKWP